MKRLESIERYARHVEATRAWIVRSLEHGRGGSCATYSPATGWSRPYPETSGYLIPTLLALGEHSRALAVGEWLLSIQNADGSWNGGLHPSRGAPKASVFNTGQILDGMIALYRVRSEQRFVDAAHRGASWLGNGMTPGRLWRGGDYRASETPSYYSHVLWPMLEVWLETGDTKVRTAAESGLEHILDRVRANGWFERSGFTDVERAFTHTIAYTLRGVLESSRILGAWDDIGSKTVPALEKMLRKAEFGGGRLAGELDAEWKSTARFECLTGSAQTAFNLLLWEAQEDDLRIVNGAAKLVDRVCETQQIRHAMPGIRGGVAGSWPIWGRYMTLRYPNWAAKYHCDALLALSTRLEREKAKLSCASF
jgi:hypothetical protein